MGESLYSSSDKAYISGIFKHLLKKVGKSYFCASPQIVEALGVAASALSVIGQILQGCQNVVQVIFLDQIKDAPDDFRCFRKLSDGGIIV